jgi:hypothetical protein
VPASPSIDVTKFPLSGDVTQAIKPWSWMNATARLTRSNGAKR